MAEGDVEVWVDGHPLAGVEDVKRKVGKIRIQDVLQAQLERIPEVRNH